MTTIQNEIDPSTGLRTLTKKPATSRLFDIDVSNELRAGDTVSGIGTPTVTNLGKVAGSGDVTILTPTHDSATKLQMRISAGDDGEQYVIQTVFTTSGGDSIEVEVLMKVEEVSA